MKVRLEVFEGPLDLLLYLIKKEELNIYDIPMTRIVEQYLETIQLMEALDLEMAGEFLVMAATLMQIKSKMLLPPDPQEASEEEQDPRAELVRRLLDYKAFKEAALQLRRREEENSQWFGRMGVEPRQEQEEGEWLADVSLFDLLASFSAVLKNLPRASFHEVSKEEFTVADKIEALLSRLEAKGQVFFSELFDGDRDKSEVIATFLALLELVRLKRVTARQSDPLGEIEILKNTEVTA